VLERHELTVAELCAVLQLPQSTASRHLKVLSGGQWVVSRREGTATLYRMMLDDLEPGARKLWLLIREQLADTPAAEQDDLRTRKVLAERQTKSQAFFSSVAGQWDQTRAELFGDRFDLFALPALLEAEWTVGDLGCGTGQIAEAVAPFVRHVIAVDSSGAMLKAARRRLAHFGNVDLKRGEIESLPIDDGQLDAAVVVLVLHHVPEPSRALGELARVIRPGGRLLIVDMLPHDHREYQQTMGHVWLGFRDDQLEGWLGDAGFDAMHRVALPIDPDARGPALFAAVATRSAAAPKTRRKPAANKTSA
jgi:ArsR family transcriptional regulator